MSNIYPCFTIKNNKIYRNDDLVNLNFEGIKEIKNDWLLYRYHVGNTNIQTVEFPNLSSIGSHALFDTFAYCTEITSISFPKLQIIYEYGMMEIFLECNNITEITFPELINVGNYGLNSAFRGCTGLTGSVSFPKLTSIGERGLYNAFRGCTGIGSVSFPKLTSIGDSGLTNAFYGCTGITEIHFRADAQSAVEETGEYGGYKDKFGATNATIYFDLGLYHANIVPNVNDYHLFFKDSETINPLHMNISKENSFYVYADGYCLYNGKITPPDSYEGKTFDENVTLTTFGYVTNLNITIPKIGDLDTTNITIEYYVENYKIKTDTKSNISTDTTQRSVSMIVPENTVVKYIIKSNDYEKVEGTVIPSNNTVNITLEQLKGKILDLSYPFTDNSEYLSTLIDDDNYVILGEMTGNDPSNCIASGPKTKNYLGKFSVGYIQFTTPDTIDEDFLTLELTAACYTTYPGNDYGVIFINTINTLPESAVSIKTAEGTTDATYGYILFQSASNSSSNFRTVSKVLEPNTTYYLCFYFNRPTNSISYSSKAWNRLAIQNIKLPVGITV